MKILDLDMDYFMDEIASNRPDFTCDRLSDEYYGDCVWPKDSVQCFLENNLGLSKDKKIKGRLISGHNESISFWSELIEKGELKIPFEVIHIDSHADLGLGYSSWEHILKEMLKYPVSERPKHNQYVDYNNQTHKEGIGDYLLFAIAYRWIERITYCANPNGEKNDYLWDIMKDFHENLIFDEPVENIIQLVYNPDMKSPDYDDSDEVKRIYLEHGMKEPEVPLLIIPTVDDVKYCGEFDYAVLAQSPNYTPERADYILEIFREYVEDY